MKCNSCNTELDEIEIGKNGNCHNCEVFIRRIPEFYKNKDFSNLIVNNNNSKSISQAKEFLINDKGLFITGGIGCGKTHIAMALLKECLKQRVGFNIAIMSELAMQLRNSFSSEDIREIDIIEKYAKGILLLDDFGTDKVTEYLIQTIYVIINNRYINNQHKIIITSNLTLKEIAKNISDRVASRISEMCEIVNITDGDWRPKNKNSSNSEKQNKIKQEST